MEANKSKESQLIKITMMYTIGNFGSKILTFLIVPLYTYYLTTSEYGIYDTVVSILNLLAPVFILAIYEGLLRWLLNSNEDNSTIIGTGLGLYLIFIIASVLMLFGIFQIWNWQYSWAFILLISFATLQMILQFIARGARKNNAFAISGVLYTIVMLVMNLCLVIYFKLAVYGMLLSLISAYFASILYLLWSLRELLSIKSLRFDPQLAKQMVQYSIMLVPNTISWWGMNSSDRIMLTLLVNSSATGIYAIACKFPAFVTIIHTLFYQAWQEQALTEYDSKSRDVYYTKIFNRYMKLMCSLVLVLIPFSKLFIVMFMSASYQAGIIYVGILYIASIFSSFSSFYGTGYLSAMDTKLAMQTTLIGALVNFCINILFMKSIGIWAACISTLIGFIVLWIIRIIQTRRYFTITVNWKIFSFLLIANFVFSGLIIITNTFSTVILLIIALIIGYILNNTILFQILNVIKKRLSDIMPHK